MNFSEYEEACARTAGYENPAPYPRLLCAGLGLAGEAGEVSDEIKKIFFHGHELDEEKIVKELGDVLWYVAYTCHELGVEMEDVAMLNIVKLRERYPDGFSTEASINRVR